VYIWFGSDGPARSTEKKVRTRHDTTRNILGFGPRSWSMGGRDESGNPNC
jgi:hypothetical protein